MINRDLVMDSRDGSDKTFLLTKPIYNTIDKKKKHNINLPNIHNKSISK